MNTKKVNVLGTEYTIEFKKPEDDPLFEKFDGYMDYSVKKIVICVYEKDEGMIEDLDWQIKKNIRHEIIHAALYESGVWENSHEEGAWALSEEMTDWIAIQFPKLIEMFKAADAL